MRFARNRLLGCSSSFWLCYSSSYQEIVYVTRFTKSKKFCEIIDEIIDETEEQE